AADRIGSAEKVVNLVTGRIGKAREVRLAVGRSVHRGEQISSQPESSAEFVFNDQTRLAVGSNASIYLDEFVYSGGGGGANKIILNAVKGAFRFSSGKAGSKSYSIRTPTSTVGVRGTKFDGYVGPDGSAFFVLLNGQVEVCNHGGDCVQLTDPCQCAVVTPDGRIRGAQRPNQVMLQGASPDTAVPFLMRQTGLNPQMQVPTRVARNCTGGISSAQNNTGRTNFSDSVGRGQQGDGEGVNGLGTGGANGGSNGGGNAGGNGGSGNGGNSDTGGP
ncbi:MAG: FecR domain-containing protein, partial [Pseudomonadota bacterium]